MNDAFHRAADFEKGFYYHHVEGFDCREDDTVMAVDEGVHKGRDMDSHSFKKFYNEVHAALTELVPRLCEG